MSYIPIIEAAIRLASEILRYSGDKEKRKYADQLVKLQKNRLEETEKPLHLQNDAKIERIDKEIVIIQDLAYQELKSFGKHETEK